VIFLSGRFKLMPSLTEQKIDAYSDATVKVFQAALLAMIRNHEDLLTIRHWWMVAGMAHQDLENVVRGAMLPALAVDPRGFITAWNANLQELTGLSIDDVRNRHLCDVVCDHCREEVKMAIERVTS